MHLKTQHDSVDHTFTVISELQTVLSELKDVQSSQRGYVITGQETYLEPYIEALPIIDSTLNDLNFLVADNPVQVKNLGVLRIKAQHRIDVATNIVEAYRKHGQQAAFDLIIKGLGKIQMDEIRALVKEMTDEEQRLLAQRRDAVNKTADYTLWLGASGASACLALVFTAFMLMHRETLRRALVEASLKDAFTQVQAISTQNILLSKMSDYFQSCKSQDEAFEIIAANVPQLLPGTRGAIAVFNNSRNIIETKISWGDATIGMPEYVADDCWALRRGRMHKYNGKNKEPVCRHIGHELHEGYVCIPMQAHGDIVGNFFVSSGSEMELDEGQRQIAQNISEQISLALANLRLQEKLKQQSIRDPMTNLYNRRYMEETMERELSRADATGMPLQVLMLDIDHFKRFNDTFGHDSGDLLIIELAKLVQKNAAKSDICCRYGGEEFLVMLPGSSLDHAANWARELSEAVHQIRIQGSSQSFSQITVSMGLAGFPEHGKTPGQLIHNADTALYKAKRGGRDQLVIYDPADIMALAI
ncbi:MAG: adrA 1 [Alphaproteobacteria bacterium]|nr:adrA 1 [Alphaproteobacteria bacterium]